MESIAGPTKNESDIHNKAILKPPSNFVLYLCESDMYGRAQNSEELKNLDQTIGNVKGLNHHVVPQKRYPLRFPGGGSQVVNYPEYLETGIMDAGFLDQLQNQIPSVVVYFWKLIDKQSREAKLAKYVSQYKQNEKAYADWKIKVFFIVMLDDRLVVNENQDLKREGVFANLVREQTMNDTHFVFGFDNMVSILQERGFKAKIEEASNAFYQSFLKELQIEIKSQGGSQNNYLQEVTLANSILYAYLQHQKIASYGSRLTEVAKEREETKQAYNNCFQMTNTLIESYRKYLDKKTGGQKIQVQDFHIACRIQELRYIIDVLRLQVLLLEFYRDPNKLAQGMIGHYGLVSRHLVWADPFSYEEHKYRAEYFRMCYEILKDYKTDKPEFTEHKKVLAVQFFMSYVRCSEQQMLSFESCGNAYMNPRLNTEEKPQYIKSNEFYGCPTGPHPKPRDPGMQAVNDTCIKKKLYFESKSAVRWKLQASIDEVSRYIGEDSSLRNTTTALKILKRKFMKEKEEPLIPASIKHLSFDEIKSLWAWDDIYQSLRRGHSPDEILEDHPYAVFLEFEKKLLSFHEVNPMELNELATKLHTWSQVPEWSPALGNLTIRTKPHPQCITTNFLSNFGIYGSEAELLIQLTLPRSVSAAWTSMSLYFNHPKYHSERIDIKLEKNKILEAAEGQAGSMFATYTHRLSLYELVENNALFLKDVVLHLQFDCGLTLNLKFESEVKLSDEMILSLPPHAVDVDLKHESTILNKEYAHMKLGLRLSPEVELDIFPKTPEDILQGEYPTVQFIFRKLGTGTNTNYGLKLYYYDPDGVGQADNISHLRKFNCNQESVYETVYEVTHGESQDINLVAFFDLVGDEMFVSGELEVRFQYYFNQSGKMGYDPITVKCSRKFRIEMRVVKPFVCHTEYQLMNPLLRETHSKVANSSNFLLYTQERAAVVSTLENRGFPIIIDQMEVRIMESAEKRPVLKIKELANYGVTQAELAANEHIKTHKYFIPLEPKEEMPALVLYVKWRRLDPKPKKLQKKYSIDLSSPTLNREESGLEGSTFNLEVSRMPLELQESTFGGPPTGSTDLASSQDNDSSANLSDRSFNKLNQSDSEQGRGDKSGNQGQESPASHVIPGYLRLPNEEIIPLTRIKVAESKIHLSCKAPEEVVLNNLFDLSYKLVNLTQEKLNLKLSLGSCPHIYLTGDTDLSLKMEPESVYLHEVKGLAAKIGLFELPTVKVISKIANTGREELVNASHQQYILVRAPIAKKTPAKNLPDMDLC